MSNSVMNYVSFPYYLHFCIASDKKGKALPILFLLSEKNFLFIHHHSRSLIILNF